jgi:hypothetical protein
MPGRNQPRSRAQARYLGAVAGGTIKDPTLSRDAARDLMRGATVGALPARWPSQRTLQGRLDRGPRP